MDSCDCGPDVGWLWSYLQISKENSCKRGLFVIEYTSPMLYAFFWVIPRRLNFICRRFGALCLFHLHRQVGMKYGWIWEMLEYLYRKRFGSKIAIFEPNLSLYKYSNISQIQPYFIPTCLWRWNRQSAPKLRHIKFRHRGITQKEAHNI